MRPIVGVEISGSRIRAVTVSRLLHRPLRRFDIPWTLGTLAEAVRLLESHIGPVSAIGIAVGFEFLFPKHIKLPPVSATEKRRMISLEPERFFPQSGLNVSVSADHDLVFAAEALVVEKLIGALELWAPVQNVEASPAAFARASRSFKAPDGLYESPAADGGRNYTEITGGRLLSARRAGVRAAEPGARDIADAGGIPGPFLNAFGAALGVSANPDEMLLSEERHGQIRAGRTRSVAVASLLAVASLCFVLYSAAHARQRFLDRIDSRINAMKPRAATAESLQGRIAQFGMASAITRNVQSEVDPLSVLAVLSKRLPRDAVVMTIRGGANDWQITGTARDAAAIIPALDADVMLENVRFLAGTSRFTEGRRVYETFSIGFNARPAS